MVPFRRYVSCRDEKKPERAKKETRHKIQGCRWLENFIYSTSIITVNTQIDIHGSQTALWHIIIWDILEFDRNKTRLR